MIDSSEKRNLQLAFELQNSHVCEKRSKQKPFMDRSIVIIARLSTKKISTAWIGPCFDGLSSLLVVYRR